MKIELKNNTKSIKSFEINSKLEARINETKEELVLRLRNSDYIKSGRKFEIDFIEEITSIFFGDLEYSNLSYVSSETYIHNVRIDSEFNMVEDFTITFSK